MLDLDGGRSVDTEELHFGLHGAGHAISFEEVRAVRESRQREPSERAVRESR